MTDTKENLKSQEEILLGNISDIKARHRAELAPFDDELREIRRRLGALIAGFGPGDILVSKEGKRVRCTSVMSAWGESYDGVGVVIRKSDGQEGMHQRLHTYHQWRKET